MSQLTIEEVKAFLRKHASDIAKRFAGGDGVCKNIVSAIHYYNLNQNEVSERWLITATEEYMKEVNSES